MAVTIAGLIPILLLLLVLGGLITGIVLWTTNGGKSGHMACGACGYDVRGLEALNCPECGADLRTVGIRRGGNPARRTLGMVLTFICIGLIVLSCGATGLLFVAADSSPSIQQNTASPMPAPSQSTSSPASLQGQVDAAIEDLVDEQGQANEPDTDSPE